MMATILFISVFLLPLVLSQDCATYCPNIATWCNGTLTQFYNKTDTTTYCETVCPIYNVTGDQSSWDSWDCRFYHLNIIIGGGPASTHCPHAGPTGYTLCGDPCNYYCDLVEHACTGANTIYSSRANCLAECYAFPKDPNANLYTTPDGKDSEDCRQYHATVALASTDPALIMAHCGHANASGGQGTCGTGCENYCDAMQLYCNDTNKQFSSMDECMKACANYPHNYSGTVDSPVTAGNSFECRKYHVIAASLISPTVHCPHAAAKGGGVCSSAAGLFSLSWSVLLLMLIFLVGSQ